MKKQYFHKDLYKDQLKQLRFIGFIALGLLSLMAILTPIGKAIDAASMQDQMDGITYARQSFNIASSHYYLFFVFCIFVPLLTLVCFHYLTKRNSSDFYHSLPHTRTCVFTCNIAAIVTWITLLVWIPTILSIIMYTIFSQYFVFEVLLLLRFSLFIYLASLLVTASISIACSLTGTVFTNVVVSGIIIFLPRIMIMVFSSLIVGSSNVLVSEHLFPLVDYQYNTIFGLLSYIDSNVDMGWGTFIYSSVLTILYLFLALLVYRHRKSETAGQSAVSRKVQTAIRLLLGTAVSLIPIGIIINMIINSHRLEASELPLSIYSICILYLVACIIMLLYELISTKKLRNVVKALPSIGILAIINVVIILSSIGLYNKLINYSPDAEEIDYIIAERQSYYDEILYYDTLANSIKITDKEALQLISDCLKENIENEKDNTNIYYGQTMNVVIGIHSGLSTHYRRLTMDEKQYSALMAAYSESEDYINAYQKLPELKGNKLSLYDLNLSDSEYLDLYNTAREEIKTLNFKDWYDILNGNRQFYAIDTLIFYGVVNNQSLRGSIPISKLLPKTYVKYLSLAERKQQANKASILSKLKDLVANGDESGNYFMNFYIIDVAQDYSTAYYSPFDSMSGGNPMNSEQKTMVSDFMQKIISENKDLSSFDMEKDYIIQISYNYYDDKKKSETLADYNFILDKSLIKDFATSLYEGTFYEYVK